MTNPNAPLCYSYDATQKLLPPDAIKKLSSALSEARAEMLHDIELLNSGGEVPPEKEPLDAGFIDLPKQLLEEYADQGEASLVGRIEATAKMMRNELESVVLLGIGGSYMGARALFEALCHRYHNELSRDERGGVPKIYFDGHNLDNDNTAGLIELLQNHCTHPDELAEKWGVVVISKSGGTLETAASFRLFRQSLENYYGAESEASCKYVVPVTGETGKLRDLSNAKGYPAIFPIPDGVGGRFSIFTAVGLLPAAIMGLDIQQILQGAVDMTERFKTEELFGFNPVVEYTAVCHAAEKELGKNIRVLSTWGGRLEAVGLWYDQLLAESLGKAEQGATPITGVNTRDLHSRGQQHQEGTLDKLITNLHSTNPSTPPISLPKFDDDFDQLNKFAGRTMPTFLEAAFGGTNQAYEDANRPTADLLISQLNEHALGQTLQMFMLATVLEGRLIGINPYGQPGVEAYKQNMGRLLNKE